MSDSLSRPCKCCGTTAHWFGQVDFAKSCEDREVAALPRAGWPVTYYRCLTCGFLFSDFLDGWPAERQRREIYNDDYVKVDPEFETGRAARVAPAIDRIFQDTKSAIRVLDFGGGAGELARRLRAQGFATIDTIDPFFGVPGGAPENAYDLLLCFEVLEHQATPDAPFAVAAAHLKPAGALLFSTLIQPDDIEVLGARWWYLAPRNGHVSLHTRHSLEILAHRHGFTVGSINESLHLGWRGEPGFAMHAIRKLG
jgi:hypothetical protein